MNLDIDDNLFDNEYSQYKKQFFEKVSKGYREREIKVMRMLGISDDTIFIAHMIGVYKANFEAGLNV